MPLLSLLVFSLALAAVGGSHVAGPEASESFPPIFPFYIHISVTSGIRPSIYNFHNFEDVVKVNLHEELRKGECIDTIASLFPYETFAQRRYRENIGFKDD